MPEQILFIELLGGIGDLVIALPAIHAVARTHPTAQLTVLTFAPGASLLCPDPLIHRVISVPVGMARMMVQQQLAATEFDLIISDTNYDGIADLIQAHRQSHQPAPRIILNLWRSPPAQELVGQRFLTILQSEGVIAPTALSQHSPEIYLTATEQALAHQQLQNCARPLVFLCPDAGMDIKRWPADRWIALGQALQQHYSATLLIPACGSLGELIASELVTRELVTRELTSEHIPTAIGNSTPVLPPCSLRHLTALLALADLVIAADTGLAHIAAALQVPTLTLFGPSWSGRYGHPAPHIDLQGDPGCPERIISNFTQQRCWYDGTCPLEWQTSCLEAITVAEVLRAATQLLLPALPSSEAPLPKHRLGTHQPIRLGVEAFPPPKPSILGDFPAPFSAQSPLLARDVGDKQNPWIPVASGTDCSDWHSVRNLLVMRLDNLGDVIMTSPALRALKANLPQAKLTLMTSPAGAAVAPLLPWVDQVLPWRVVWQDLGQLSLDPEREWQLIGTLQSHRFDAAMIFTSFSQSPHPAGLACALAGIPLRLGESKEVDGGTLTHAVPPAADTIHQVERNLRLLEFVGFTIKDRHLELNIPPLLPTASPSFPYLLLNPWTSCSARNYEASRFAAAANQLSQQTDWPVVITGMGKDQQRAQSLLEVLGDRAVNRVGETSFSELVALVAQAQLVLTNNTSVMHIADATQTPMVVTFAGTELESQWRPRDAPHRILRRPTPCSPCYQHSCPYQLECLNISVESVVLSALELLGRSP